MPTIINKVVKHTPLVWQTVRYKSEKVRWAPAERQPYPIKPMNFKQNKKIFEQKPNPPKPENQKDFSNIKILSYDPSKSY